MGTHADAAPGIHEYKIRASLLLKDLLSEDPARATRAVERFRALPQWAPLTAGEVLARRDTLRHKHALAVIAAEQGHRSWAELKAAMDARPAPTFDVEVLFSGAGGAFLNRWFPASGYAAARASLREHGGFLFPYRDQFVICAASFLEAWGIDAADPDWRRLGWNWVEPKDAAARARLERKLLALGAGVRPGARRAPPGR
jgi:hypothetical protein